MERLLGHVRQGILTNDSAELAELKQWKLYYGVIDDVVVVSAEVGAVKPNATIYEIALQRAHMTDHPERALFIDDKAKNCEEAEAVGMQCIRFQDATQLETELRTRGIVFP